MAKTCSHLETPELGTYCPSCGVQVRCKSCRKVLTLAARFCIECGSATGAQADNVMSTDKPHEETNNGQRNIIEFEEDTKGRRFHATVSDNAIEAISHPFSLFLTRGTNLQPRRSRANASDAVEEEPLVSGTDFMLEPEILDRQAENVGRDVQKKLSPATDEQLEMQRLKELFRERGGRLRLEEPQLKAKGKLDYTQRLTYLFLYAEERAGNESVPRSTLTTILDDSSVSDGNARSWIAKESALVKDGDNVHLNSAGRRAARAYLKEVFTDETQPGWLPGEAGSSRSSKMKTTTSKPGKGEQPTKGSKGKGGRTSKVTTDWVPKWTALGSGRCTHFSSL